jgi:carbon starvation protein
MKRTLSILLWLAVALLGAWAYLTLAVRRGEHINSIYILLAALCSYAIGYRFYSKWVSARVLALNDRRATPCEVHEDGKDYVKTNKWIVFGHHFAAISGPGPLLGPVLAAQFGYLPGTLWILIGVVLGGAVQDFIILFSSMRRDGKSLAQMVKEELNPLAGVIGMLAILAIMTILLAVLALVVVKALAESPWGVFTVGATIPIAMVMGGYLRFWRVGKVLEVSGLGVVLLLLAVWGGKFVYADAGWSGAFTVKAEPLAWSIIAYGFAASVLPVWLLLAPRDYLSTFMKLGTIFALAVGVFVVLPDLKMPALSKFIDGTGLVVPGKLFPFCFITIACGAISGFHTLISSGTTPKMITRESYARPVGYGAMLLESLVAIMAMVAACTMDPGSYHGMNVASAGVDSTAKAASINAKLQAAGASFTVDAAEMDRLADVVQEKTLFNRTGGASTLAVGMAQILSKVTQGRWLDLWYHFALMFEALFILTTLDAGTRVGRYLIQDALKHVWAPMGETGSLPANIAASGLVVLGWGSFLIMGVRDPDGGVKALWPIFGIANQLLASLALCLATTVILKMQLRPAETAESRTELGTARAQRTPAFALVTVVPLLWLLSVTVTAGVQKVFHPQPRIGFLAAARDAEAKLPGLEKKLADAQTSGETATITSATKMLKDTRTLRFNNRVDAAVTSLFLALVIVVVLLSVREWVLLLGRRRLVDLHETAPVWLPKYAAAEGRPLKLFGFLALVLGLARHLTDEAALQRAKQQSASTCACPCEPRVRLLDSSRPVAVSSGELYARIVERRFNGVNRCC